MEGLQPSSSGKSVRSSTSIKSIRGQPSPSYRQPPLSPSYRQPSSLSKSSRSLSPIKATRQPSYRRPTLQRSPQSLIQPPSKPPLLPFLAPCFPLRNAVAAFILTFVGYITVRISVKSYSFAKSSLIEQDWYDGGDPIVLTGMIQILNLFTYAIALFFAGPFIDKYGTRMTLVVSIILSGILTGLFATLGFLKVHAFAPYAIIWAVSGIIQSVSGPSLVTIAGSWLNGVPHRGFILCLWSGNQNVGNLLAGVISGLCLKGFELEYAWQGSMLVCGIVSILLVIPLVLFLVPSPTYNSKEQEVVQNCSVGDISFREIDIDYNDSTDFYDNISVGSFHDDFIVEQKTPEKIKTPEEVETSEEQETRYSMIMKVFNAFFIPGVSFYSIAFAMSKGTNYIYLYWLPYMMTNLKGLSESQAAYVSTVFDAGAFAGSICAGLLIDYFQKNDIILVYFALNSGLSFLLLLSSVNNFPLIAVVLFFLGFFVGGPISVISICASVDIQHKQMMDDDTKQVSSVVPAIIQGSGSLGAVLILFIVNFIIKCPKDGKTECSWINLFYFVFAANCFAFFLLAYFYHSGPVMRLVYRVSQFFGLQPSDPTFFIIEIPKSEQLPAEEIILDILLEQLPSEMKTPRVEVYLEQLPAEEIILDVLLEQLPSEIKNPRVEVYLEQLPEDEIFIEIPVQKLSSEEIIEKIPKL